MPERSLFREPSCRVEPICGYSAPCSSTTWCAVPVAAGISFVASTAQELKLGRCRFTLRELATRCGDVGPQGVADRGREPRVGKGGREPAAPLHACADQAGISREGIIRDQVDMHAQPPQ